MPAKGVLVDAHEVEGYVSLATLNTTVVPLKCGWYWEVALVGGKSPADGCAHLSLKTLLFGGEHRRAGVRTASVFGVSCDIAGRM